MLLSSVGILVRYEKGNQKAMLDKIKKFVNPPCAYVKEMNVVVASNAQ